MNDITRKSIRSTLGESLETLAWTYYSKNRGSEAPLFVADLIPKLFYASYVSANREMLGLSDFDERYVLPNAIREIGNTFSAVEYLSYFTKLQSPIYSFPEFEDEYLCSGITLEQLRVWFEMVSRFNLEDDEGFSVAHAIREAITSIAMYDSLGKDSGEFATNDTLAELMISLAGVEGKRVCDFVCGNGTVLSLALEKGAREALGNDLDFRAANRAKITCFFGNPAGLSKITTENILFMDTPQSECDIVFAAPPIGARISPSNSVRPHALNRFYALWYACFQEKVPDVKTLEEYCLLHALAGLDEDGIGILHMSTGFLYRSGKSETQIRDALVRGGFLQAVVELPAGAAFGTSVKTALFVLGRKRIFDDVLLIDMDSRALCDSGYYDKGRGRGSIRFTREGVDWLKDTIESRTEIPFVSRRITLEDYFGGGSVLSYARFGEVVDVEMALKGIRKTKDIVSDIEVQSKKIQESSNRIDALLAEMEASARN